MADPDPISYSRLTRTRRRLGGYTSLCLAPDHLVHITSTGYTESYRRFYFKDIQAIILVRTHRRMAWNIALSIVGLIVLLSCLGGGAPGVVDGVIAGVFGGLIIVNSALGIRGYGVIVTAVQREKVESLARWPRSKKVLDRLLPLISAAQGIPAPPGDPPLSEPRAEAAPEGVSEAPKALPPEQ
jgi:hypothetical protein